MREGTTARVHVLFDIAILVPVQLVQIIRTIVHDLLPFFHGLLILRGWSLLCGLLAIGARPHQPGAATEQYRWQWDKKSWQGDQSRQKECPPMSPSLLPGRFTVKITTDNGIRMTNTTGHMSHHVSPPLLF